MTEGATISTLLARGAQRLRGSSPSAALDAELLLGHVLARRRAPLRARSEEVVAGPSARRYLELIERRAAGEPLAYLTGRREFWSLELAVTPDVLVPRPETELVVERALALGGGAGTSVLDLGAGSGAIALALAHERPAWLITAVEISAAALAVARRNAAALGLERVRLLEGCWYGPVAGERFRLIVSNPPYVGADDPALRDAALRCEPQLALTPGSDALAALRMITAGAVTHLYPGGWLVLEHGAGQAEAVAALLVARGLRHVRCHRDLAGHARVTEAQSPSSTAEA